MIYPEIPKGKRRGTYIAGGIFLILFGIPIFLLFTPVFFESLNIVLWDWTMAGLGINADFLEAVRNYVCYLALPAIMTIIGIVGVCLPSSKSALMVKGANLCFVFAILLRRGLWFLDSGITDSLAYVAVVIVVAGLALLVLGYVWRFLKEKDNPQKANSFLLFTSTFWAVIAFINIILALGVNKNFITWILPFASGLYGVVGGLWMLCLCIRPEEPTTAQKAMEEAQKDAQKEGKAQEKQLEEENKLKKQELEEQKALQSKESAETKNFGQKTSQAIAVETKNAEASQKIDNLNKAQSKNASNLNNNAQNTNVLQNAEQNTQNIQATQNTQNAQTVQKSNEQQNANIQETSKTVQNNQQKLSTYPQNEALTTQQKNLAGNAPKNLPPHLPPKMPPRMPPKLPPRMPPKVSADVSGKDTKKDNE